MQKEGNYTVNEEGEIIPYEDSERRGVTYNDINNINVFC